MADFRWVHVHNVDELQAFFVSILPRIREAARSCGYAIGAHGSMRRDLDLIAAPWIAEHSDADTLVRAIHLAACGIENEHYDWGREVKPCGRRGISAIPVCWIDWPHPHPDGIGHIDLALMPDTAHFSTA